jgi:hypothetical protein
MTVFLRLIGGLFVLAVSVITVTVSPSISADRMLLDPDWDDPGLTKARTAMESARAARPSASADAARDADVSLSLPRWGLANRIDRPTADEQSRARRDDLPSGSISGWPSCAKPSADLKPLTDKTGLWYSDTYDFGCVVISISGDRSAKPDMNFPDGAAPPDECSDQSAVDSNETDTRGRFDMQFSLNRIPYEIVGRCSDEAEIFCRSRAARCALVGRLILRGGSPQ